MMIKEIEEMKNELFNIIRNLELLKIKAKGDMEKIQTINKFQNYFIAVQVNKGFEKLEEIITKGSQNVEGYRFHSSPNKTDNVKIRGELENG